MPFVAVDGLRVHVLWLRPSAPEGTHLPPPAAMIHGFHTGTMASWFFTCAPTLAKQRPVFLYDLRGHGRTDVPADGDISSDTQAGDLHALLPPPRPFHVVGHSFGALIAIRFALLHPDRVASLTLVEPPLRADGPDAEAWWWSSAAEEAIAATATASLRGEAEVTDADLRALPSPLAVVVGDRAAGVDMVGRVQRVRPDAEVAVFAAGHSVHVDAREELTLFLQRFLVAADLDGADAGEVAYG